MRVMKTRQTTRVSRVSYIALALLCAISSVSLPTFSAAAAVLADEAPSKIAFDRGGNIYTMNADGTNQTLVGEPFILAVDPSSSPDGKKYAFTCGSEPLNICVMNADGTNFQTLTNENADGGAAWSPDGTRIAFTSFRELGGSHIYLINPDGTGLQRLPINDASVSGESGAAWSPDGTRIAFVGQSESGYDIYTASLDGAVTRVTFTNTYKGNPTYSPDGAQIAFDTAETIAVVNAGGGAISVLTSDGDSNVSPAYSPDGARIAFRREVIFRDENGSIIDREDSIYVMNADGTNVTNLNASGSNPNWQRVQVQPPPPPVKTPAERISDLDALVRSFNLPYGTTNSLTVKLRDALNALNAGNTAAACAKLADFTNHTRAQSGKKLTAAQATQLIDEANSIRAALGCS
jgi:Tol biopolymer transport system component